MIRDLIRKFHLAMLSRKMRKDWDRRARVNALHYVNTGRTEWDETEFFATGEANVRDQILSELESICQGQDPATMRVLEIGCGVGRMTRALAATFGEVHGVDVSAEMVRRAREFLKSTPNAHVHCNSGRDLQVLGNLRFDFAFSFIVFQHIPSRGVIDNYVREAGGRLRPGALFKFQVQGYQGTGLQANRQNTWLGASISESQAREMAARYGFEVERSAGIGTQYYWLWFRKT